MGLPDKTQLIRAYQQTYRFYPNYWEWTFFNSKLCRPRADAAKRGVWSGSILFATYSTVLAHQQVVKWTGWIFKDGYGKKLSCPYVYGEYRNPLIASQTIVEVGL